MPNPNDVVVSECCQILQNGGECDYSHLAFQKDVYEPNYYNAPAIYMTILTIITLFVVIVAGKNLKDIYATRKRMSIKASLLMNSLVCLAVFFLFLYALDGPIRLMFKSYGFAPLEIQVLQVGTVGFFLYTLAYASYTWIKMISVYKEKWGDNKFTKVIKFLLFADVVFITIIIVMNVTVILVTDFDFNIALTISFLFLSIGTFINGVAFSISCYILATHLKEIYNFDARKQTKVKVLRGFAWFIAFLVLARVVNDMYSYAVPEWQTKLKMNTYCNKTQGGSLYLFFYMVFADLLPQLLFLVIFSPSNAQKAQNDDSSNEIDWDRNDSSEELESPLYK